MADRFIAFAEETSYDSAGSSFIYFKILNESINPNREDYFPETTEYWTTDTKVEGHFSAEGDTVIPVEPIQWPKLLVLHCGDPTTTGPVDSAYTHVFKFGANETIGATGVKNFTVKKGVGIEKDIQMTGGIIENITIEYAAKEPIVSTVTVLGSGNATLETAASASYSDYTQNFYAFHETATFTVGGSDRLDTAPTVEAFTINLRRGIDADHYVLGSRGRYSTPLSGFASVEGTLDLSFTSEDELERFMGSVGTSAMGDQASFEIVCTLTGELIGSSEKYDIEVTIPEAYYTESVQNVTGRDRIIQTINWRGNYNASDACAAKITVVNGTDSYTSLS